jgi:hypothetical protein
MAGSRLPLGLPKRYQKGLKLPLLVPESDGNTLLYQRVTSCCQNCKTFVRRFDPGPRLQFSQQLTISSLKPPRAECGDFYARSSRWRPSDPR